MKIEKKRKRRLKKSDLGEGKRIGVKKWRKRGRH